MAPTESRLGGRLRVRHRVHGHRPGGPDPQADRRPAARHAVAGLAAVHQLHGRHGRGHAPHRRDRQPDRRQAHPADRPGHHHRRRRAGRVVQLGHGDRGLARPLGSRQRPLRRHGARDHRVVGPGVGRAVDHPVRGGPRPRHRRRTARRRHPRRRSPGAGRSTASPPSWPSPSWSPRSCYRRPRRPPRPPRCSTRSEPSSIAASSAWPSRPCSTTSGSSPCWPSRRSPWT